MKEINTDSLVSSKTKLLSNKLKSNNNILTPTMEKNTFSKVHLQDRDNNQELTKRIHSCKVS